MGQGGGQADRPPGIARGTARTHPRTILGETEAHRQAELAWLLARLSGWILAAVALSG